VTVPNNYGSNEHGQVAFIKYYIDNNGNDRYDPDIDLPTKDFGPPEPKTIYDHEIEFPSGRVVR